MNRTGTGSSAPVAHLHVHTAHSALDGTAKVPALLEAAAADGQPALAITDHGTLAGTWRFATAAHSTAVKPILGIEAYLSIGNRFDNNTIEVPAEQDFDGTGEPDGPTRTKRYEHLTMLAATPEGWSNLLQLTHESESTYRYKPRLDWNLMARTDEHTGVPLARGIIAGTGCLGGPVAGPLLRGEAAGARSALARMVDLFGRDGVFVEVMDHGIPAERRVIPQLVALAREFNLPVVATNDSHYVAAGEAQAHDVWLCIGQSQRGRKVVQVSDTKRFRFQGSGYHLRTGREMHALFDDQPGTQHAVANTLLIAERVHDDVLGRARTRLPQFRLPDGFHTPAQYLHHLVLRGARQRYGVEHDGRVMLPGPVAARLRFEENVINDLGYPQYFLIEWDMVQWARSDRGFPSARFPDGEPGQKKPILVGPGRGSGAGSMTLYCLRITNIEPLSNGLLFERFLDPSRNDMPDIDTDFEAARRDEVVTYLQRRYGSDRVARIGTWNLAWSKRSIRDVARVTNRTPLANALTRAVHVKGKPQDTPLATILHPSYPLGSQLRDMVAADPQAADLVTLAGQVEGVIAGESIHPCGVVIADEPLVGTIPLRRDRRQGTDTGGLVTQWDAADTAAFGLVKFDLLFLKDLDVVSSCLQMIEADTGERLDVDALPMDPADPRVHRTWALLAAGRTAGVFQLAGPGITELTVKVRPTSGHDLAAILALYRPGPMAAGMHEMYVRRRNGVEPVDYRVYTPDPAEQKVIAEVLDPTLGSITYQEQLMSLGRAVADFGPDQTNKLRKAFSKKIKEEMDAVRGMWVAGGRNPVRRDGTAKVPFAMSTLDTLWVTFNGAAQYLFNASHSYAYGYVCYVTAFLKANWPSHYGAALLRSAASDKDKRAAMLLSLRAEGVPVLPPDVNEAQACTAVDRDGAVRIGLSEIAGAGEHAAFIVQARHSGPFTSLTDLYERVRVSTGAGQKGYATQRLSTSMLDALIEAGACDSFGPRLGMRMAARALSAGDVDVPDTEWGVQQRALRERMRLGTILGDHSTSLLKAQLDQWRAHTNNHEMPLTPLHLLPTRGGMSVNVVGLVSGLETVPITTGSMIRMTLESRDCSVPVLLWPKTVRGLGAMAHHLKVGRIVGVTGRTDIDTAHTARADDGPEPGETPATGPGDTPEGRVRLVGFGLFRGPLHDPGRPLDPTGSCPAPAPLRRAGPARRGESQCAAAVPTSHQQTLTTAHRPGDGATGGVAARDGRVEARTSRVTDPPGPSLTVLQGAAARDAAQDEPAPGAVDWVVYEIENSTPDFDTHVLRLQTTAMTTRFPALFDFTRGGMVERLCTWWEEHRARLGTLAPQQLRPASQQGRPVQLVFKVAEHTDETTLRTLRNGGPRLLQVVDDAS